jgi:hypothetical protein
MELTSNKTLTTNVRERRRMPRFHLLTRVDIAVASGGDLYWGSMLNLSRTGVAVVLRHHLQTNLRTTVRFHFQSLDGKEVVEELSAKAAWQCEDSTGLEFEAPLTDGSPALQKARFLMTHLEAKEAGH